MFPGVFFDKPIAHYTSFWRVLFFVFMWTVPLLTAAAYGAEPDIPERPSAGIAMHGDPKYPADFKHFDYVNPAAPKGGVLRLSALGTFDNVNPYIVKGTGPRPEQFNPYVFESLMYRSADEPFSMYPWLAITAKVADDRSWVIYTLNAKARWQDGKPVTTDDLLFTRDILVKEGRPAHRAYYGKVASIEKTGKRSVKYTFKKQTDGTFDREMPLIIGLMPILPKHFWQGKNFSQTTLNPVMGSGAYRIAQVDAGRRIVLERQDDYWAADLPVMRGHQNFKTIQIDYYRDEGIAREAFLAGKIDLRFEADPLKLKSTYQGPAVSRGDIQLETVPHYRPEPLKGIIFNTRRPLFGDVVLRRALRQAGDFTRINETLYGGAYKRSYSSFANSALAAPGSEQPMDMALAAKQRRDNLRLAQQMLQAGGYVYKSGKLLRPNGDPVTFEVLLIDPADERLVLGWRETIKPLGVDVTIRTVDSAQFQARLNDFNYDAVVFRWINSLSPGNEQLVYWGSKAADTLGSRNYAGVKDPVVDALAAQTLAVETYPELVATAQKLDAALIDGAYVVPFFYLGADLVARWKTVQCPTTPPLTGFEMRSCWYGG